MQKFLKRRERGKLKSYHKTKVAQLFWEITTIAAINVYRKKPEVHGRMKASLGTSLCSLIEQATT